MSDADSDVRDLLKDAFEAARTSGRSTWWEMTAAVLKNRLLQLTRGSFDESQFGAGRFLDLLERYDDFLEIDRSRRPPVVRLKGVAPPQEEAPRHDGRARVRPDLWNAIVDYSSGAVYVWDPAAQRAVALDPEEALADPRPVLPTITPEDVAAWREDFLKHHRAEVGSRPHAGLVAWVERGLSSGALPPALRNLWNGYQRERVVGRLAEWFGENGFDAPSDIVVFPDAPRGKASPELRRFVVSCIERMTDDELRSLMLPVSAIFRTTSGDG